MAMLSHETVSSSSYRSVKALDMRTKKGFKGMTGFLIVCSTIVIFFEALICLVIAFIFGTLKMRLNKNRLVVFQV